MAVNRCAVLTFLWRLTPNLTPFAAVEFKPGFNFAMKIQRPTRARLNWYPKLKKKNLTERIGG